MQHRYEHRLLEEAEAGRKFLQQLRKPHDNDVELDEEINLDYLANGKEKKVSLRASLERLIEEYLRKITADSYEFEIESRQRRHSHNISIIDMLVAATDAANSAITSETARGSLPTIDETIFEDDDYDADNSREDVVNDSGEESGDNNQDNFDDGGRDNVERNDYDDDDDNVGQSGSGASEDTIVIDEDDNNDVVVVQRDDDIATNDVERIELGSRKINASSNGRKGHEELRSSKKKTKNRKDNVPEPCFDNKRRISHLDKIELENSLKNLTEREFNIRNLLNYR